MTFPRLLTLTILGPALCMLSTHTLAQNKKAGVSMAACEKYIDEHQEAHLKEFLEIISIPTISSMASHKPDIEKAANWIVDKLKAIGMTTAKSIPTDGNPIVFGRWDHAPGKPTVLIYAHYDVQPVKESEWTIPPFSPKIENGKIYGRGASDDKSGVMISIWSLEAMLSENKKLPVNVKLVFDGEEESGSPNFKNFLIKNKELLKTDYALNADGGQFSDSIPSLWMSFRGGVQLQFTVKTADIDAHSGAFGGKTPNAVIAMSQIISSFYDQKGNVAVEGFYDKVLPLTPEERAMINKVPYDPSEDMKTLGTTAETGDSSYSPLERVWYRPTLEIIGMQGGYTAAEGFSNIIPSHAMARISCRLVNNQTGDEIIELIVKHISKHTPAGATVNYQFRPARLRPMKFPADTRAFKYVSDALTKVYGREPLMIAEGGSVGPLIDIKEQLGVYAYSLGFEIADEKWHSANEFFRVSSIRKGQLVYCNYFQELSLKP